MKYDPTPEQKAILEHDLNRSARILAGPGTGKSATVVALLDDLLRAEYPLSVSLLTFTRAATAELAQKVSGHPAAAALSPSTVHSFSIRVLLQNPGVSGFPEPLRIADDWESHNIVQPTLRDVSGFAIRELKALIGAMETGWGSLKPMATLGISDRDRARFLGFWEEHRRVFGYTLLAEIPYRLREALESHPDLCGLDSDALIVDEYQDLNACDLDVLHLISQRGCSVIAVGDDDQSIYSFRSAAPEGIRRFAADYPESDDYTLSVSHRCSRSILRWANHIILGDTSRPSQRPVVTAGPDAPTGEVALLSFSDQDAEARGVADLSRKLIEQDQIPPGEILVLMRTDHNRCFSSLLVREFESKGINTCNPSAVTDALADPNNRRLLASVRLLVNPSDSLAWATLLHLTRGLGQGLFSFIYAATRNKDTTFAEALHSLAANQFTGAPAPLRSRLSDLYRHTNEWLRANPCPSDAPSQGWGHWLLNLSMPASENQISETFQTLLVSLDEIVETEQTLGQFVSQIHPLGKDLAQSNSDGVRLMSMASSKGLTVSAVICLGVEEGVLPHPRGIPPRSAVYFT